MDWLVTRLGIFWDLILGPRKVYLYQGQVKHREMTVQATYPGVSHQLSIQSQQVLYHTVYTRTFIPDRLMAVYVVVCDLPEEHRERFDPRLFIPQTFPVMANRWLNNTEYPHTYAMKAFLDQFETIENPNHLEA